MVTLTTSTVITGLFLVAVIAATVVSSRRAASDGGRRPRTEAETTGRSEHYVPGERLLARLRGEMAAWVAGFLLLAVGFGGGAVLAVGDAPSLDGVVLALLVALLGAYLLAGVYLLGRQRGHSTALAVAESATAFGVALIAAVVFQLVTA
ncbi:hypothetical protein BRD03_12445 [Halobacteriales archaeon QS_9_68_17]|nr:MAG: hypothetical protein BRD03_12445 [Halobacteriales archaeon QS_9_68_17]